MGGSDNQESGDEEGTDVKGSSERGPEVGDRWCAEMRRRQERELQDYLDEHTPAFVKGPMAHIMDR